MKNYILILCCFLLSSVSLYSQSDEINEPMGEGDLYLLSLQNDTTTIGEERIVVNELFSGLSLLEIREKAKNEKKIYYIDFTADWCQPCRLMEQTTFRDFDVVNFTHQNFYALQLDMSDFDAIEMQAMYNISSLPTILFFDHLGNLIGRTSGLQTGTLFLKKLKEIKAKL